MGKQCLEHRGHRVTGKGITFTKIVTLNKHTNTSTHKCKCKKAKEELEDCPVGKSACHTRSRN